MSVNNYPLINKIYAAFIIMTGSLSGVLLTYFAVYNSEDVMAMFILVIVGASSVIGSIYVVYQCHTIKISMLGVSSNRCEIAWQDVSSVNTFGYGIHIHSAKQKIVVSPWAYKNPKEVSNSIQKALHNVT